MTANFLIFTMLPLPDLRRSRLEALAREMKFRPSFRKLQVDARKAAVDFRSLGLSFAIHSNGEIHLNGALGTEFPPDAVLAGASSAPLSTR